VNKLANVDLSYTELKAFVKSDDCFKNPEMFELFLTDFTNKLSE